MGLFGLFKGSKKDEIDTSSEEVVKHKIENMRLNRQIKAAALEVEMKRYELEKVQIQNEIDAYKEDDQEEGGMFGMGPEEMMLINILTKGQGISALISGGIPTMTAPTPQTVPPFESQEAPTSSYDRVRAAVDGMPPETIKAAQAATDEQLKKVIKEKFPQATESEVHLAIAVIREQKNI